MNSHLIFGPFFAMLVLVFIVGVLMLRERVRQFKALRLHPQKVPTRKEFATAISDTRCADNFMNLFEIPMMFYVVCFGLYVTQTVSTAAVVLAWVFVLLRYVHSYVQCSSNIVMRRFKVFVASCAVMIAMWGLWGYALLMK